MQQRPFLFEHLVGAHQERFGDGQAKGLGGLNPISTIRRIRSACCARAASGQAAALPSSVMNARRFIR